MTVAPAPIVLIAIGLALAFAGKRFFWLVIAIAGFVLGYRIATFLLPGDSWVQVAIGAIVGLLGASLTRRFTSFLIKAAAFIIIGNVFVVGGSLIGVGAGSMGALLLFLIGGLVGLALMRFVADIALVLITAIGGAGLVMEGLYGSFFRNEGLIAAALSLAIIVAGFVVQQRADASTSKA